MQTTDHQLLSAIAHALTDHMATENGASNFADLTTGEVTFIQEEYMFENGEITEEEINDYQDWQQDQIRTYLHHDLIEIEPIPSHESFRLMEAFADSRNEQEQTHLYKALNRRGPFSCFRYACNDLGILQQWYDFKNEAEIRQAQEWLTDNGLAIKDGKIVRIPE